MKLAFKYLLSLTLLWAAQLVHAEGNYVYTEAAKVGKSDESRRLLLPSNPAFSGVASISETEFTYSNPYGELHCSVPIDKHEKFFFDVIAAQSFGTSENLAGFFFKKFGLHYKDITDSYLLGGNSSKDCQAFTYSKIYASRDSVVVWGGDWMYIFRHLKAPARDATGPLECKKANTEVERMICQSSDLVAFDEAVNLGFAEMQDSFSKEISSEDPIRLDQIRWIRDVRNKCVDATCLINAYKVRIAYFKRRLFSRYPSYPEKESEPRYD
ncbi:hypothetical protein CBA19CS22_19655 [Caballeronia novacaledonica]|uniref:Uncharacterized protein n=1 Tax=Caballeronia novacaledonica TaxID=1544861 RepID=A0ACB5QW09_9BURK|nr:hypothetical protein CBA19CS22_19655 [Caballeronia novacaledonica]